MRVMALDVGDKTIGVAVCDELGITIRPVTTVRRSGYKRDLPALAELVAAEAPERIVVGLPLNMDGTEGPRAERTRRFAAAAEAHLGRRLVFWDERLSTHEAEARMRAAGVPQKKRKALVDQYAAVVILEAYLAAGAPDAGALGPT